jgi:hypothetical protein
MQYHLFIDESGDPSLNSINLEFPVFTLLGCLFDHDSYLVIEEKISKRPRLKRQGFYLI